MPHIKTTLKCDKCGEPIYSDEGFKKLNKPGLHYVHCESCQVKLKPHQCKRYVPPKDKEKAKRTFIIPDKMRGFRVSRDYD